MPGLDSYTPRPPLTGTLGRMNAYKVAGQLPPLRTGRVHEPATARVLSAKAVAMARRAPRRFNRHPAAPQGREPPQTRPDRPRLARNRTGDRAAHPRSRTQADLKNRCRAEPYRYWHLRLLRGNRPADRHPPARGASDRDAVDRGPGAARTHGAHLPRRVNRATGARSDIADLIDRLG